MDNFYKAPTLNIIGLQAFTATVDQLAFFCVSMPYGRYVFRRLTEHTASNFRVKFRFMWMLKLWGMCRLYGKTGENLAHKSHGRKRKKALVSASMSEFHNRPF